MPHSSEAIDSPPVSQPSSPLGMQPWSREEDAVLLRHALQCGTKQWGELERSGQLKRSNKSCCNRYIFLRRKFTHHYRESFLRNHLGGAAFLQDVLLDGDSSQLLCQDFHHQQQEKQQRAEGVGSPALAFGGLSLDECTAVFFAPNARCCRQTPSLNLSSLASPPPSRAASVSATEAALKTDSPVSREAFPVAAASNSSPRRALKRPRDDSPKLGAQQPLLGGRESWLLRRGLLRGGVVCSTEWWRQSVAEQFQQQGASSCVQDEEGALLNALLLMEHRQLQQGGARSRAQRVLWPRVGSESALLDDVLLGCSSDEPASMQRAALSAPPPIHPHAVLAAPMPSQLATLPCCAPFFGNSSAGCGDLAPCIGGFAVHGEEWLRVAPESALPDDVLLGLCFEDPALTQRAALSAPAPAQPFAAPMPLPLAGLPGPAPGSTSRGFTAVLAGSTCGTQEQEYLDACVNVLSNINNTDNTDKHSAKDNGALFLDTPLAHVLLGGSTLAVPLPSGPHTEGPAVPSAAGATLPEWAEEQGGTGEGGAEQHRQQQYLDLELDRMLSLPPH
ncbi:unnamed protein product [Closterium sp. NIES-53]